MYIFTFFYSSILANQLIYVLSLVQIFVFSTQWANKAAESVMQSNYPSIISWHENQPDTKKHLEVGKSIKDYC